MAKTDRNRPRLGRGLSSLISVSEPPDSTATLPDEPNGSPTATLAPPAGAQELPIDLIAPNPHQPRRAFDQGALAELACSIKSTGIIQPVIVRRTGETYQLIAGERRWRAARLAGLSHLPALVRDVDSFTQAQMALIENIQREDLNPIDRALGYKALLSQLGLTQSEVAIRLGEDRSSVSNYLRLLELSEPVRDRVRSGELSLGHAKLLAGVSDGLEQQRLAELVISQDLSVRNLERLLQSGGAAPPPRRPESSAHLVDLEKSLARQLGMRIQVRATSEGRGRLVIHYASLDQFDDLIARLGLKVE
jgi:ParB family transcriptional regulator, chromosome partitioning protein